MNWWDRIETLFRREAADVREGLRELGESLDEELARKELRDALRGKWFG